jgi:hypothetical protein
MCSGNVRYCPWRAVQSIAMTQRSTAIADGSGTLAVVFLRIGCIDECE